MQIGSRRMRLVVAGATIAWLIGVALVSGGTGMSMRVAAASASPSTTTRARCGQRRAGCGHGRRLRPSGIRAGGSPGGGRARQRAQMSEEAFKNIQVLKGIPVDEFMGAMGLFSAALSMCCLECHAPDYAADTPRKVTTRKMIQMVNTINADELQRTKGRQLLDLPSPDGSSRGHAESRCRVRRADLLGARRSLPASAGRAQTRRGARQVHSGRGRGRARCPGSRALSARGRPPCSAEASRARSNVYVKAPNQRTTIIHQELGDKTMTFDGRAGWLASAVTPVPVLDLTGGELGGARLEAELSIPGRIKQSLTPMARELAE